MTDEKWELIKNLDLNSVKAKLYDKKSLWWKFWNNIDTIEAEYRQFLYLIASNPGKSVVPWSEQLDDFWHQHILDTEKYNSDCQKVFGKFVHHNPHLPIGSEKQVTTFAETKQMYRDAFKDKAKRKCASSTVGCSTIMPVVFCASAESSHSHDSSHSSHSDSSHDSSSHDSGGHSCSGHSCHSCSGHSCSSCGSH